MLSSLCPFSGFSVASPSEPCCKNFISHFAILFSFVLSSSCRVLEDLEEVETFLVGEERRGSGGRSFRTLERFTLRRVRFYLFPFNVDPPPTSNFYFRTPQTENRSKPDRIYPSPSTCSLQPPLSKSKDSERAASDETRAPFLLFSSSANHHHLPPTPLPSKLKSLTYDGSCSF